MSALQVLVSTMNQTNIEMLYKKMNLKSDALVINQSDYVNYEDWYINDAHLECYTFNERGLSKSRNNALMRCNGEIICIADDDVIYSDSYVEDIINEFKKHPKADAIVFNVDSTVKDRSGKKINCFSRVGKMESREYGSVHIVFRREAVIKRNVFFHILFGSGAKYKCGEDTIFLKELLSRGLRLYKSPITIGVVDMSESSWFSGYNQKYFFDKGAIIACIYPNIRYFLILIQSLRNSKKYFRNYAKTKTLYKWYLSGANDYMDNFKSSRSV